ncbi:glutamine--fructose-6-phosphate transaminase (isomerizing) [Methanoplanus limicola]|uniref:Glutamine--fructose-6-phosphate aminotransferase [isomerizing] n=1 Tax=Methanoplanus limicola DSM 2279 TaxID=937775 RepID=H1YX03_9EURY|nr:glutamine--fructose-6-phosphate transaminase (isomerizing) [Methanoplanus limicola]EHQ34926.1 glutamine--fructose-6-phosphate transaminase [Methanoplanus limicola DSM 2279]
MCGIVGYFGYRNASDVVIEGLKKLEYRGYDSFGIATVDEEVKVYKCAGRISESSGEICGTGGTVCIGHTRWATHGIPDKINAHPHTDSTGRIAIVHNGIIENYMSLKSMLIKEGCIFKSDTDSEVIAHLIGKYYNGDLLEAVTRATEYLEGAYAFLSVVAGEDRIVAARDKNPLVIGIGDAEIIASSDVTPILEYTRNVYYVDDGDIISIDSNGASVFNSGVSKAIVTDVIDWEIDSARKGGFDHYMQKEIYEEPDVFYRTFNSEIDPDFISELKSAEEICVIACGTSYNAGLLFRYLMEMHCDTPVRVEVASECRFFRPRRGSVVIAVTQSGETADTIAALNMAKAFGCTTAAVTNVVGSSVTRVVDYSLCTRAGPEISVAATKSYTAQVAVFMSVLRELCNGSIKEDLDEIHKVIEDALLVDVSEGAEMCAGASDIFYVGRGLYYPVSLEGALKIKEITYIHAEGYAAGELKHGPISLLCEETPIVAVCTMDVSYPVMLSNIKEMKARGAPVIAVGTEGDEDLDDVADVCIYVKKSTPLGEMLAVIVVLQMLAYQSAVILGRDIDKPRNLAKSVTVI